MVALVLRRLAIPGAYLAAAIFALHPVQVESVAWITELKNTLSAVFYLGAVLVYLRFDQTRRTRLYSGGVGAVRAGPAEQDRHGDAAGGAAGDLLVAAGTACRGRRDVLPLVPFFVLGAAAGVFTAWVERKLIGAEGAAFELTLFERCLMAGRAIWFYLGKLFWPADLIFIYPRWHVSQAVWWQYLFPAGGVAALGGVVGAAAAVARAAGGAALLRRNAVSGAGLLQCVSVHLFVRGRSFSVSGEPGDHRRWRRPGRRCCWSVGGFGVGRPATCCAWRCWPSWPA